MNRIVSRLLLVCGCLCWPSSGIAEVRNDYELTVAVVKTALKGWQLWQAKEFAGDHDGGQYTDPDPTTQVKNFWSNGRYAQVDRDDNGHHETIFLIRKMRLVYVGSLGTKGTFIDTSKPHARYQGRQLGSFVAALNNN